MMRRWMFGWVAAAIAVAAGLALAADISHKQSGRQAEGAIVRTLAAAKAAGADVFPTDAAVLKPVITSR